MTSSQHHAFAPFSNGGSNPLVLDGEDKGNDSKDERSQLIDLFQTYADMYPNPRLIEEYRSRDTLLQAASAANAASASMKKEREKSRGFFSRWWNGDDESEKKEEELGALEGNENAISEDPLVYIDADVDTEDEILCGTMHGLDLECIPIEVYSLARLHLTSNRTRGDKANVFREGDGFASSSESSLVVVGLGEIVELSTQQEPCLSKTSDRDMLLAYAAAKEQFSLSYVRATVIAENCIAVSWGFLDGIVVIYRRVQRTTSSIGWETVWILGPSNGVLENMSGREFFHDDEDHPGSPLLRVSDCLPLRVETGHPSEPTVITLALARLGGYIELIPLPQGIWDGPALARSTKNASNLGLRNTVTHYTSGRKIESPPNALALTTSQCHIDVLSLHALRTSVGVHSPWNVDAFPDSPPSEYIICASGMNEDGLEVVSFWDMGIIVSEVQDQHSRIGTKLHSSLIEAITAETGANISFFATPDILKRWRKARCVAIREDINHDRAPGTASKSPSPLLERTTTISISAPIVKLELSVHNNPEHRTWLTVMDWNGGVAILDCELIERFAAKSVSNDDFNAYQNADHSLATTVAARNQISNVLKKTGLVSNKASKLQSKVEVCDIKWIQPIESQLQNDDHPLLIMLVKTFGNTAVVALAPNLSLLFAALTGKGEAIKLCYTNRLTLIEKKNGKRRKAIRHFTLQKIRSQEKIDANQTNASPKGVETMSLSGSIQGCHLKGEGANRDIDTLATSHDPSMLVPEVLSIIRECDVGGAMTVESLRMICQHAIRNGRKLKKMEKQVKEIRSFLVKLGTYQLVCQHLCTEPALIRFREKFQSASLGVVAQRFAARADLAAVTIIMYRHRIDLDEYIKVLDSIPHSTDPTLFAHLIPVFRNDSLAAASFLFRDDEDRIVTTNWSNMPSFGLQTSGVQVTLDPDDNENVLEGSLGFEHVKTDFAAAFRLWLLTRATFMQRVVGNAKHAVFLLELGMQSESQSTPNEFEVVTGVFEVHLHYSSLMSFIIEVGKFMVDDEGIFNAVSSFDLVSMKAHEIVEVTLNGEHRPAKVVDKCFGFLWPFAMGMAHGKIAILDLDSAISSFYIDLVEKYCAIALKKSCTKAWFHGFLSTISVCVAVAEESRTSKPRGQRIIREIMELQRMVNSIFVVSAFTLDDLNIPRESHDIFLNTFWQLCETLPATEPFHTTTDHEDDADTLFCSNALVGFEIFSQWPGCAPFSFLAQFCRFRRTANRNMEEFGIPSIVQICKAYCAQVRKHLSREDLSALLGDLLEDATKLNMFCFQGSIDLPFVLTNHLVPLLLKIEEFEVVMTLVEHHSSFIEYVGVELEMLEWIEDETLVQGEASTRKISRFVDHANEIKKTFHDTARVLDPLDRCIKACHFINSFIFKGSGDIEPMAPITLKYVLPLDLIDCILEVVPESVEYAWPQWVDLIHVSERWLQYDIEDIRSSGEVENAPDRVGGAILYLAGTLGCTDDYSTATVKCKVVEVALKEGFQEAAIALCQTMIREWQISAIKNYATAVGIASAIHNVSMDESSRNILVTRELCQKFITEIYCSGLFCSSSVFSILSLCPSLDLECICFASDQQQMQARKQESLSSLSLLSLRPDQQSRLSILLLDFRRQISGGKIQDSTISALCMGLIDVHITTLKAKAGLLKRNFSAPTIFFGSVLVLHISGSVALTALLHSLLGAVETASYYRYEDDRDTTSTLLSTPDSEVVHSLTKRGYSKCAAARATIMCGNRGFRAAQEWAIAHTLQAKSNQPFLHIQSSRQAETVDEPIQTLRKVFEMLESLGDGGAAELLLMQNLPARTSTLNQSELEKRKRKQVMTKSKMMSTRVGGKQQTRNVSGTLRRQHESSDTEKPTPDSHPKSVRSSQKQNILQVERSDSEQPLALGALSTGQSPLRVKQVSEKVSSRVAGTLRDSTRDRLIEEGRLLLQKTMGRKCCTASSTTRSTQ